MALLPNTILPPNTPFGTVDNNGKVIIEHNWWLLIYNLCLQILGTGTSGLPSDALQDLSGADIDAADSDAIALRKPVQNLNVQVLESAQVSSNDLPDIARSLLLAQDSLLPDAIPLAQPIVNIAPTGSVFTYTAPAAGTVVVSGGVVSVIAIVRHGTSVTTGLTDAVVPVARYDQVQVTYSGTPTMSFIPWSSQ